MKRAHREVDKGREAIKAVLRLLPEDDRPHADHRPRRQGDLRGSSARSRRSAVPLYEGMLHARTLAPIRGGPARRERVAGVRVVESEAISTEVIADLGYVEAELNKAAKALEAGKAEGRRRGPPPGPGPGGRLPLSPGRQAAGRGPRCDLAGQAPCEESNAVQAGANLAIARQRLEIYRQVLPEDRRAGGRRR